MKILILGDIHGRTIWKEIIDKEQSDLIIFLGDYVSTHENISSKEQCDNLREILNYKIENPNKVILLRGNHDTQFLGYLWAQCSGFDKEVSDYMINIKEEFLSLTQWIYIYNDIIFSHAGISQVWLDNIGIQDINEINSLPPSEIFGFTPDSMWDDSGTSETQPLTWIRPQSLVTCNIENYDQVVGHTPVKVITDIYKSTKKKKHIWLCDNLPEQYLVIEDNNFIVKDTGIIILSGRYGNSGKLVPDGEYYKVIGNNDYITLTFDDSGIIAFDPPGGPYTQIGDTIKGKKVVEILDNPLRIKLE